MTQLWWAAMRQPTALRSPTSLTGVERTTLKWLPVRPRSSNSRGAHRGPVGEGGKLQIPQHLHLPGPDMVRPHRCPVEGGLSASVSSQTAEVLQAPPQSVQERLHLYCREHPPSRGMIRQEAHLYLVQLGQQSSGWTLINSLAAETPLLMPRWRCAPIGQRLSFSGHQIHMVGGWQAVF